MSLKVNLEAQFTRFSETWSPKIIADLDDYHIKLTRLSGDFPWHAHGDADEMFYILDGQLRMEFRDRVETLSSGELIVIPKGVEHRPVAENGEVKVLLIEKASVVNTGDGPVNEHTKAAERMI
jgi:mannose-6-phosphate isomerase-like protein (cupin superfamily)